MSTPVQSPGGSRAAVRFGSAIEVLYIALFVIFLLAPIVIVVLASFTPGESMAVPVDGLSLRWYRRFLEYKPFTDSLVTSLILAFVATVFAILLAVPAALGLAHSRSRIGHAASSFLLSPIAVPPLVVGLSSLYYLSELGIGNSFVALLITHTCVSVPYVLRTTTAACKNLNPGYGEAASVLGASVWQRFWHVTLPLISPGIFAGALFSVLVSLDNLGVSYFFGSATTTTLPVVMLSYLQNQFDPSIAAISTVQMLIAIAFLLIVEKIYGLRSMDR